MNGSQPFFCLCLALSPAAQVSLGWAPYLSASLDLHPSFPACLSCGWTRSGPLRPSWWSRPSALASLHAHPLSLVAQDGR